MRVLAHRPNLDPTKMKRLDLFCRAVAVVLLYSVKYIIIYISDGNRKAHGMSKSKILHIVTAFQS